MLLCYTDIAIIVFNNCTEDNNGNTVSIEGGGEVTVTQDSPYFTVTFNYEFLEDFRAQQQWQHRVTDGGTSQYSHSESGVYESPDVDTLTTASDEADDTIWTSVTNAALRHTFGGGETWNNDWGPVGFNKKNHPLNIMVCIRGSIAVG